LFQVTSLRNTIRLLRDELWQLKMSRTSNELSKLVLPLKDTKSNEIADIYKSSTLLLNVCLRNEEFASFFRKRIFRICILLLRIIK